jgi:hypothetical protein
LFNPLVDRYLNGVDSRPLPLVATAGLTNQITGPTTLTVTVPAALGSPGPGLPLSLTVYVKVRFPVTPGGGSTSNTPVDELNVTAPPDGVVEPTAATVKAAVYSPSPLSGSVAPSRRLPTARRFMFVWTAPEA